MSQMKRCARCGAGPIGNCGAYGAETQRELCPKTSAAKMRPVKVPGSKD